MKILTEQKDYKRCSGGERCECRRNGLLQHSSYTLTRGDCRQLCCNKLGSAAYSYGGETVSWFC